MAYKGNKSKDLYKIKTIEKFSPKWKLSHGISHVFFIKFFKIVFLEIFHNNTQFKISILHY